MTEWYLHSQLIYIQNQNPNRTQNQNLNLKYPGDLDGDLTITLNDLVFLQEAYKDNIPGEKIDLEMIKLISRKHQNYDSNDEVNKA